jgi:hypothetical protein
VILFWGSKTIILCKRSIASAQAVGISYYSGAGINFGNEKPIFAARL